MPADGTLAAITPAEISASLPRQRQLEKDCTPPQQTQLRSNLLLYQRRGPRLHPSFLQSSLSSGKRAIQAWTFPRGSMPSPTITVPSAETPFADLSCQPKSAIVTTLAARRRVSTLCILVSAVQRKA